MESKTSCVEIFEGKKLEDHYQILVNPEFVPALLVRGRRIGGGSGQCYTPD